MNTNIPDTTGRKPRNKTQIFKKLALGECSFGKAVYADEAIRRGDFLLKFGGDTVNRSKLPASLSPENDFFLQYSPDKFLGASQDLDDFINHSCSPNCAVIVDGDHVWLRAIKRIPPRTEISFDYSTTMTETLCQLECSCGSPRCRGNVTHFAALHPSTQAKYIRMGIVPDFLIEQNAVAISV